MLPPVENTPSSSWTSSIWNLIKVPSIIYRAVASIFIKAQEDYYRGSRAGVIDGFVWPGGFNEFLCQGTPEYPMTSFKFKDGHEIQIAKTWLSDFARIGSPDKYFIDGIEIGKPLRTQEDIEKVLSLLESFSNGNPDLIKQWTQQWNHRLKITLRKVGDAVFKSKYKLEPIFGEFNEIKHSLDTHNQTLTTIIEGHVPKAIDRENPIPTGIEGDSLPNIVESNIRFKAVMTYDFRKELEEVQPDIHFFEQ